MYNSYDICKYCIARQVCMFNWHSIIIIIIERRDFGGVMSDDCKDILQTQNKTVRVRRGRTRAYLWVDVTMETAEK